MNLMLHSSRILVLTVATIAYVCIVLGTLVLVSALVSNGIRKGIQLYRQHKQILQTDGVFTLRIVLAAISLGVATSAICNQLGINLLR